MNTGEHRWRIPVGRSIAIRRCRVLALAERSWIAGAQLGAGDEDGDDRGADGLSSARRASCPAQPADPGPANVDPHLWVYDKATGEKLAEIELPANATGSPITYMAGGKQFIAFPVGGGGCRRKS